MTDQSNEGRDQVADHLGIGEEDDRRRDLVCHFDNFYNLGVKDVRLRTHSAAYPSALETISSTCELFYLVVVDFLLLHDPIKGPHLGSERKDNAQ